ncbi:hypothetical protein IP92_05483 [Pseudoduganella flava]|uniref:Phasin family protein n=1 Tax=Pseudoduganella flava TaxID=871742 RepID=A0A562PDK5_9BURK|nr:hypothetical protein [Pseudoduganella flava]QGZ42122.1 hypothetical protein GO485_25810 [Pseudoduganella flava]TWI42507.1 hypothetical protein IP92_05483 [Pseudoduganella flava]
MTDIVARSARTGTTQAVRQMETVAAAASDVSNVDIFMKFAKKAGDTAQAAL